MPLPEVSLKLPEGGDYETLYRESISNPDKFWGELAMRYLKWEEPFGSVRDCNTKEGAINWFTGGKLNVSGRVKNHDILSFLVTTSFSQLYLTL